MEYTKVNRILSDRKTNFRPLSTLDVTREKIRFNLVTDSIMNHSLFGGVATAIILVTNLCRENNWDLRLVTRTTECNLNDYFHFLKFYNIEPPKIVEGYSDAKVGNSEPMKIEVSNKDIFFATSWWSAKAIMSSNIVERFFYILQEEETFFYNYGDEHLWCSEVLNSDKIDFIINSKLLYDYFVAHGYEAIKKNGIYFEPAFEKNIYFASEDSFEIKNHYKMFFYGRPNNPRNLFYHGLELLDEAITRGIIDTAQWDIYLAGGDFPEFEFSNGYVPKMKGVMSWSEYAEFARTVDLSFSLMYTPHPSYPPFDMTASGAVTLTNTFANKRDLEYSDNMICADIDSESMMSGFEQAIKLAQDPKKRKFNYLNNEINTSWDDAFKNVIMDMKTKIERY